MAENLGSLGYIALIKEVTKGTIPSLPSFFATLMEDNSTTDTQIDTVEAALGLKTRFASYRGLRKHKIHFKVLAEPSVTGHVLNMLMHYTGVTGAGPYTHSFAFDSTNPKSYTIELGKGQVAIRYLGVELQEITPEFQKNQMVFSCVGSALGAFTVAEVSSVTGAGPYTVTLKTNYDPNPTTGLLVGDTIRFQPASGGNPTDCTIASIVNGTQITTVTNVSALVSGDYMYLRLQTPTASSTEEPFMWARTEWRFSTTATLALTATQTRVEQGSTWKLIHNILPADGADRSGSFDPASLPRGQADAEVKPKIFFDIPDDYDRFLTVSKRALVIRHFEGTGTEELRVTFNNLKNKANPVPNKPKELLFASLDYHPNYDTSDGQTMAVTLINNITTY